MDVALDGIEKAFDKELFLIKNDLYYQQLELERADARELLRIDIAYKPHSALSGDTYSVRKTHDGCIVGFVADAMGKGISAAVSAMAITRFLNYFFDEAEDDKNFTFERWIERLLKFLSKNLIDEEIMCVTLFTFEPKDGVLQYAACGMPAFLVQTLEGEIISVRSNNPPLMSCTDRIKISTLTTMNLRKLLCYTDGLCESITEEGVLYASLMKSDFGASLCIKDFRQIVEKRIGKGEDDITFVYVEKTGIHDSFESFYIASTYEALDETLLRLSEYLKAHHITSKQSSELLLAVSELLLNALEHGSFGLSKVQKAALIESGAFESEMVHLESENNHKMIRIDYGLLPYESILPSDISYRFEAIITDEGEGFDTKILKNLVISPHSFNGRGIMIVKKLLDHFYFNEKGNAITIQKFLSLREL